MRTHTDQKVLGTDSATDFHIRNNARANNELQIYDSQTVKVESTTRGIRLHAKIPPSSGGGKANVIRGEWDGTLNEDGSFATTYNFLDEAAITLGPNAGDWIWINPASGNSPPYLGGANWFQRPIGGQGNWT